MRKLSLTSISLAIVLCITCSFALAQELRVAEREAEWNQHPASQANFVRQVDPTKILLFQVPEDWQRQYGEKVIFKGPHGSVLNVIVEKISDGLPLRDYISSLTQSLRSLDDSADSLVVRRTTMAALDAREIVFESDAGTEEVTRRIVWTTVSGPNAINLILIAPVSKINEIEPVFKAVVQSVTLLDHYDYAAFDALRTSTIKDNGPARVDEVQSLAASFTTLDISKRRTNIARLATIFASSPGLAIDLVLDRRPMVRAAVFEAIATSRNKALEPFVLRALDDREPLVAEQAARSLASNPNVRDLLRKHSVDWFKFESLARVWPFLNRENQIKILGEMFEQKLIPAPTPPPIVALPPKGRAPEKPNVPDVIVGSIILPPGTTMGFPSGNSTFDPSRHFNALTLLRDLPVSDMKLPFAKLLAGQNDSLTYLALQIASERNEFLPAAELLKLLSSCSSDVRSFATWHLGDSGSVENIKTIEGYLSKASIPPASCSDAPKTDGSNAALKDELQLTISKIRFREQLAKTSGESRAELIKKSLENPKLAEWLWNRFVWDQSPAQDQKAKANPQKPLQVLPLGQNLFPKSVAHYAAIPQPAIALGKLNSAFDGLQLESARSQANLVLILSVLREQLAQMFNSPPGASPIAYSGINTNEPIAVASWFAEGAPTGVSTAQRQAIILRVTDRARFERTLAVYQRAFGNFKGFTNTLSGGLRTLTILPAILPISAKALLEGSIPPATEPLAKYTFIGGSEWNGYPMKVIEQRRIEPSGRLTTDAAYITYLGDTAVIAPDLISLRDVLTRAASQQSTLAENSEFKRITEKEYSGEAFYLSNVSRLLADSGTKEQFEQDSVTESGALKISNLSIESLYRFDFKRSESLKSVIGFQPGALTSPRELLPRSTIAYYFMNLDAATGWRDWSTAFSEDQRKDLTSIWAIDFEKDVLPELGPECGVAVLGVPNVLSESWTIPWVAFARLKSDKLARAFQSGKLLTASGGPGPIHLKLKSGDLYVALNGNFLVLSNTLTALDDLNKKEKLAASRDFARASERAPANVVAFGGYSLEAAIASINDNSGDPMKAQQSAMITSLTNAFHSPNFYATATPESVEARFSLSMDREGRFSVADLSSLSKEYALTYAQVETHGVPIQNQERLNSLRLRIQANAAGEIDRLVEDVTSNYQTAVKLSDKELELKVLPRKSEPKTSLQLPIKGSEFDLYLQPAREIRSDDKSVIEKARSIAGEERDAWKVAGKLADWTFKNITWKRVDRATAAQTLATLEADCLEFSQLYVAMARSLGLPARLVSGLAYSGASFGGHAWVEVYVGEWMELDPTWGTPFVDATHIRNSANGTLLTYASLNLIKLEVLDAPRGEADYQKDPRALTERLSQELPNGNLTALTSALDLAVLTEEYGKLGTWDSLSDLERQAMTRAYRRILLEINAGYRKEGTEERELRVLGVKEDGDRAEAIVLDGGYSDALLKFRFLRRNGAWFLTELHQIDADLRIIFETLQPTIATIISRRNNNFTRVRSESAYVRALVSMQRDPKTGVAAVDRALKEDPKNRGLRHLKALASIQSDKTDEAIQVWTELAAEANPFAPALLGLARQYEFAEEKDKQKLATEFYIRYGALEPEDPRTHAGLARLYEKAGDDARAEAEHRAASKSDPAHMRYRINLANFLAIRKRFTEVALEITEAEKRAKPDADPFGDLMMQLHFSEDATIAEELAQAQPQRMGKSHSANLHLAYILLDEAKSLQAIPLLKKAAGLKKESAEPYEALARAYRNLRNWTAALRAADTSISLEPRSFDGYFSRACALARLGRTQEALKALEKAAEIDPDLSDLLGDEADLKSLASHPRFKKLFPTEAAK